MSAGQNESFGLAFETFGQLFRFFAFRMLEVNITSFSYRETPVLKNIEFSLEKGEHLVILGESGCGKSTLLHIIYGLLHLEEGTLFWGDKQLKGPKFNIVPGEPFIKLVAQEFNVMPYTTVAENVATYLPRIDAEQEDLRVNRLLEVVDLTDFATTKVKDLSGGQKQRVALAKALANEPELLLLDEPFSHIDTFRKNKLRRSLFSYLKTNNITCITATHDSEEALGYADRIVMLNNQTIEVIGTPESIYLGVDNGYQGSFFGEVNILPSHLFFDTGESDPVILYPHQLQVSKSETPLRVEIITSYFKGSHYLVHSRWNEKDIFFENSGKIKKNLFVYLKTSK